MTSSESGKPQPLADRIEALAKEVEVGLIRVHDYYSHTQAAWKIVEKLADDVGSSSIVNPVTSTSVTLTELT